MEQLKDFEKSLNSFRETYMNALALTPYPNDKEKTKEYALKISLDNHPELKIHFDKYTHRPHTGPLPDICKPGQKILVIVSQCCSEYFPHDDKHLSPGNQNHKITHTKFYKYLEQNEYVHNIKGLVSLFGVREKIIQGWFKEAVSLGYKFYETDKSHMLHIVERPLKVKQEMMITAIETRRIAREEAMNVLRDYLNNKITIN